MILYAYAFSITNKKIRLIIIILYVAYLNFARIFKELTRIINHLKKVEIKNLEKTKFYVNFRIKRFFKWSFYFNGHILQKS